MKLENINSAKISVIGLGYVGLPLASEFSKHFDTIGFDINENRIIELKNGIDKTNELDKSEITKMLSNLYLTSEKIDISKSNVYIITVPTPIDEFNNPDLSPLISASEIVGQFINKDDVVLYESTVFPGATEEICVPILEKESGLKMNHDFYCGYSPERINPGDKKHTLTNIVKVTSGSCPEAADFVDALYSSIIKAGTFKVSSIKVAESAKIIENVQRDVNIALINELSIIFNKLKIDTTEVLEAARSKWNFLDFRPGLVGGHCIGVDPYYLAHKSLSLGYRPEVILSGRKMNDDMALYVAKKLINELNKSNDSQNKVGIFGLTFKEDCPDLRNSKVFDIYEFLIKEGINVILNDPCADENLVEKIYRKKPTDLEKIQGLDAAIFCVAHHEFKTIQKSNLKKIIKDNGIVFDLKSIFDLDYFINDNYKHWRL